MRDLLTVMKFTMKDIVRKKSFIISTIIILVLIVVGFSLPKIIKSFSDGNEKEKMVISDTQNIFEGNLDTLNDIEVANYKIEVQNSTDKELKELIKSGEINSAISIEKVDEQIQLKYIVENKRFADNVPEEIVKQISAAYSTMQMKKLGITEQQLQTLTPNFTYAIEQTKEEDIDQGNVFVMMIMSFALSMAIILFTAQVSTSITTEKTSKIMETLVTSTSPRTIVLGKTIGIGLIGLIQVVLVIVTALISANIFLDPEMISSILDLSKITPISIIITLVYFVLGYFVYACGYALTGSLVSKPEDIQSANMPISLIAMVGFYFGYFSISIDPTSSFASFASLLPISSAFCMPARIIMGLASWTDIALSIVLLIAMTFIVAKIAIKVYSNAILNYGSKMSLKDAIKMYKNK